MTKEEFQLQLNMFVRDRIPVQVFPAIVESVDEDACTCHVTDTVQGLLVYDVRLRAVVDNSDLGLVCFPERGSSVLVGRIGNSDSSLVVLAASDLSKVTVKIGASVEVTVDSSKIELKAGDATYNLQGSGHAIELGAETLKAILSDLITQLEVLTVTCSAPASPSSPPINLAAFTAIKTRLNGLFQ